jgi:hypothetical protein
MLVTVSSVTNNSDGTYTITFSEVVVNLNPGVDVPDPNIILFTPASNTWVPAIFNAPSGGFTIVITATGSPNDCTLFAILDQPGDISASDLFQIVAPITPAT